MGLFDRAIANADVSGFKTLSNTSGWSNEQLLEILEDVETPFGFPKLGWIKAFGKERQVIIYNRADVENYAYIDAQPGKITISMAQKPGLPFGASENADEEEYVEEDECAGLINAVEELADVVTRLQNGESPDDIVIEEPEADEDEESVSFFMDEDSGLSLKTSYSIFNADDEPAYFVEAGVTKASYKIMNARQETVMEIKPKLGLIPEHIIIELDEEIGRFKRKISIFNAQFNGTLKGRKLHIEGNISGSTYDIELDDDVVGRISPASGGNREKNFEIEVFRTDITDEIVSIAAVCANLIAQTVRAEQAEEARRRRG